MKILIGFFNKDYVHIHIEYPPRTSVSQLVKRMKGISFRKLQKEFPYLRHRHLVKHFWAKGHRAWSRENITYEMVQEYLK